MLQEPTLQITNLNAWLGKQKILNQVNVAVEQRKVLSVIGPMGSGKSTLLRCINRLFEEIPGARVEGKVELMGRDVYGCDANLLKTRRKLAMIFAKPTPFAHMSLFENVAIGLRLSGEKSGAVVGEAVEKALMRVELWDSLKNDLHKPVSRLSEVDWQRLCLARALVLRPKVLLMDEPTGMLDLQAGVKFEQIIRNLREKITIVLVSRSRKQAARISDQTAFMLDGELIEIGKTSNPISSH